MNHAVRNLPVLIVLVLLAPALLATDQNKPADPPPPSTTTAPSVGEPALSPEFRAWITASTPGEPHKRLEPLVGTWDAAVRHWEVPGAPPQSDAGVTVNSMILGGRYLRSEFAGTIAGVPFEGVNTWGYNNLTGKYESTWICNAATEITFETGACDATGRVFTMIGEYYDASTGGKTKIVNREVITLHSADRYITEFFEPGPDGKEFKSMEIVYTRRKNPWPVDLQSSLSVRYRSVRMIFRAARMILNSVSRCRRYSAARGMGVHSTLTDSPLAIC